MGLFDRFKKKEDSPNWADAYQASPQFYSRADASPFGAFTLTEETDTILPKTPRYAIGGKEISDYKLFIVSTTKDAVIGDADYFGALKKLERFIVGSSEKEVLVRGLSLEELESLL